MQKNQKKLVSDYQGKVRTDRRTDERTMVILLDSLLTGGQYKFKELFSKFQYGFRKDFSA